MNVVLKTAGDPHALIPAVRRTLKDVDPQKPAHELIPLEELLGATYARDRQAMVALLVFAGTAIFLAVLSVYSVLAQRVRERSGEIGLRMALGADASSLVGWVATAGLRLLAIGLAAGLLAAWGLSVQLEQLLFGVGSDRRPHGSCRRWAARRHRPGRHGRSVLARRLGSIRSRSCGRGDAAAPGRVRQVGPPPPFKLISDPS